MNDKNIKGIMIRQKEIKITQFADDTTIILNGTEDSLQAALNIQESFGNISGLRVNTEKTQIVWIGKKKGVKDKVKINKELHWGSECLNYEPALNKIRASLAQWQRHLLSPIGKITVLKSFIVSKLNYLFLCIPDPSKNFIKTLERLFFKFIWNNKPDKIRRNTICMDYKWGGLENA